MNAEFAVLPGSTVDTVRQLGAEHALPPACRGSGGRGALRWLAAQLGLHEGSTLLDSGAGRHRPWHPRVKRTGTRGEHHLRPSGDYGRVGVLRRTGQGWTTHEACRVSHVVIPHCGTRAVTAGRSTIGVGTVVVRRVGAVPVAEDDAMVLVTKC